MGAEDVYHRRLLKTDTITKKRLRKGTLKNNRSDKNSRSPNKIHVTAYVFSQAAH